MLIIYYTFLLIITGMWITNILIIVILKTSFTIIPGISSEVAWTLTNVVYNLVIILKY